VDSDHTVESEKWWWPPHAQQRFLGKEDWHRLRALTDENKGPNGLFDDLFAHRQYLARIFADRLGDRNPASLKQFTSHPKTFVASLGKSFWKSLEAPAGETPSTAKQAGGTSNTVFAQSDDGAPKDAKTDPKVYMNFARKTYYLAKNWTYSQDNYYAELEGIQHRIDFSRSCFLIGTWTMFGMIVLILFKIVIVLCGRGYLFAVNQWFPAQKNHLASAVAAWPSIPRRFVVRTLVVAVSISLLCLITRTSYALAEQNFNERVFGYFATHLDLVDAPDPPQSVLGKLGAESWMQISPEYASLCRSIYANAQEHVGAVLGRPKSQPLAVVLDLDETVFRNARFQGELITREATYSESEWREWVQFHASDVEAVPGALEFLRFLKNNGVVVVFVSNRPDDLRPATLDALKNLGIIDDVKLSKDKVEVYLQEGKASDKQDRFNTVRQKYQTIAYVGDQIADFPVDKATLKLKGGVPPPHWPKEWFLLPNPTYGGWEAQIDWRHPSNTIRTYSGKPLIEN
jgi:acid phosphatase